MAYGWELDSNPSFCSLLLVDVVICTPNTKSDGIETISCQPLLGCLTSKCTCGAHPIWRQHPRQQLSMLFTSIRLEKLILSCVHELLDGSLLAALLGGTRGVGLLHLMPVNQHPHQYLGLSKFAGFVSTSKAHRHASAHGQFHVEQRHRSSIRQPSCLDLPH